MMTEDYLVTIRDAVRRDKIEIALKLLQELLSGADELTEVLSYSGRYEAVKKDIRLGTVNWEKSSQEKNSIRLAILDFLTELEIEEMCNDSFKSVTQQASSSPEFHQQADKIYNITHIEKAEFS